MSDGDMYYWFEDDSGQILKALRTSYAERCDSSAIAHDCVCVVGHDGDHFCYDETGALHVWGNGGSVSFRDGIGYAPIQPDDPEYIHPKDNYHRTAIANAKTEEIADYKNHAEFMKHYNRGRRLPPATGGEE